MYFAYFTVILTVTFLVHYLLLFPPDVGGDANLQGGVEEPEPDLVEGKADLIPFYACLL